VDSHDAEANVLDGAITLLQMLGGEVDVDPAELVDDVSVSDEMLEQLDMVGYL